MDEEDQKGLPEDLTAFLSYEAELREAIGRMKYENHRGYGVYFGRFMARYAVSEGLDTGFDMVVPVPLHEKRLRQRGYNQAQEMAAGICQELSIPMGKVLRRVKETRPLKALGSDMRRRVLWEAFEATEAFKRAEGQPLKVLLVDDIVTTGATFLSCKACLEEANPACRVYGWALTRERPQ